MEQNKKVHEHLDEAKNELINAAAAFLDDTKSKTKDVVGRVATSISEAADKVHADVIKVDSSKQK